MMIFVYTLKIAKTLNIVIITQFTTGCIRGDAIRAISATNFSKL